MPQPAARQAVAPPTRPTAAPPAALSPATAAPETALLAAFLSGAGLTADQVAETDPGALMARAGEVLHAAIQGLWLILGARAMVKTGLRMEQTVLHATDNNPLKCSFSADQALIALLARPRPGYLEAGAATRAASQDVMAHQMALLEAMSGTERLMAALAGLVVVYLGLVAVVRAWFFRRHGLA